jgi:uncharacterized heparinase superfamily protein
VAEASRLVSAIRIHCPASIRTTVNAADTCCRHVFDLLGSGPVSMGPTIDWHCDFTSGHRYDPSGHSVDLRPAAYPGGPDIKVPWELSRCQHLVWLGQAYWFTNEETYAREFVAQVTDWIAANPPRFGVNWASTMDVAIRAVNWLWAYHFLRPSPALTDAFLVSFHKSLLAHGRHIIANLERWGPLTTNHYLADLAGLAYLGLLCPHFREAPTWRDFGLRELWREMGRQVYPDGVDFEASIAYHRLAVELFLSPIVLCQLQGVPVPDEVMRRLEKMLEFVMHYTRPDGTVPLIGDSDNGRLARLRAWDEPEREWVDHRYLLAIAAVLFRRVDFGLAAGAHWHEAFWMWGERALRFKEELDRASWPPPRPRSRAFADGGLYFMRDADAYVAVDAGPSGQIGHGGHAHNDTLSFEFHALGQSWVVDPGSYVYTADYGARHRYRSSSYHNIVVIDDQEINRIDERLLFRLSNDARPAVHAWDISEERDVLVAGHDGYRRLTPPASCRRAWWLDKQERGLLVCDEVEAEGLHRFAAHLHLMPSAVALDGHLAWVAPPAGEARLAVCVVAAPASSRLSSHPSSISRSYGRHTPAPVLRVSGEFHDRLVLAVLLLPFRHRDRPSPDRLWSLGERLLARCRRESGLRANA